MTRFTNIITLNHGGRCFCEMFELNATSSPSVDNSNLSDGYAAAAPGLMNSLKGIQHLSAESLDIYEELEIFRRGLASVRFVSIRDGGADEREAWLLEAFPDYRAFEYIENETSSISTREGDFNILVFGGNDIARMRRFLKQNHGLLINRVKICLMRGSDARRRAAALMAGFDDVFDTMKSQPLEGLARAHSIWRRYHLSLSHVDQTLQLEVLIPTMPPTHSDLIAPTVPI